MQSAADSTRDQPSGAASPSQAHPRRPPAHLSVSLRHESPSSSNSSLKVQTADLDTDGLQDIPIQMDASVTKRHDTEDSNNSSESNAGQRWFDTSNKDGHNMGQTYIEDDSPYFLRHNSSGSEYGQKLPPIEVNEHRPAVTINESTDEYRSVIDDLTIENKKLRERLRKYEKTYDPHLERDKLFEVRPHGLPPRKRRELEELLHTFASSIHGSARGSPSSQDLGKDAREAYARTRRGGKDGSSSSTSNSRPIDSAYASGTTSGPKSTSTTNQSDIEKRDGKGPVNTKEQHVESFLQDIPLGLHPKHSPVMTEQSKKKMVVRKLEQLFTGSTSTSGADHSHSQPLQQQEVSNSAAQADRQAIEKQGQKVQAEGVREANMLPIGSVDLEKQGSPSHSSDRQQSNSTADGTPSDNSPNQRPTRPLDLDPDRAQVPQETVEYIRHLGLSTPSLVHQDSTDVGSDDKGWVYLNLLISMAQLHIINVTPDFVRNAVQDLSTKLQLSQDGRKIRWRGGMDGTKLSNSDSGDSSERKESFSDSDEYEQHTSKRRKGNASPQQQPAFDQRSKQSRFSLISMDNRPATRSTSQAWVSEPNHIPQNRFAYRPLFNHHSSSPSEDMSYDEDDISPGTYARDGEAASVSRSRSASSNKKRNREGAIIYYSGAPFCTDLSGDNSKINPPAHIEAVGKDGYSNHTRDVVGCDASQVPRAARLHRTMSGSAIVFRPFKDYSKGAEMDWDRPKTPDQISDNCDTDMGFSPGWSGNAQMKITTDMTVSGLGAIRPADHFDICVETRRTVLDYRTRKQLSKSRALGSKAKRFLQRVPKNSRAVFDAERPDRGNKPVKTQIVSQHKKALLPSTLPPPATFISNFSSSSEEEDSSTSCGVAHLSQRTPFPRRVSIIVPKEDVPKLEYQSSTKPPSNMETHLSTAVDESDDDDGYSEDDDDESIDMLAPLRAMDPDTVAAQEEEYEKDKGLSGRRIGEDILGDSNGATVDGGSRFTSELESGEESDDESEL